MKFLIAVFLLLSIATHVVASLPEWSYDPGPNPHTAMGKELIDLTAAIPHMPEISQQVMASQKFRPAFGPVPWRMLQDSNKVKILFIGQDATHIAEAAGRPATAGFGGRAQDLAAYFGVNEGAAFINTYAFTIKGQYGAYDTPYIFRNNDGQDEVRFSNLVENKLWLLSQDIDSPIVKWRNNLIDWIVRNNKSSIKLIVTFGGAARDAMGSYIESKGGKVGSVNDEYMNSIQIAETKLEYAGGNNEFPVIIGHDGKDLYPFMLQKELDYTKVADQAAVKEDIKDQFQNYLDHMVFTKSGPMNNGLIHPAQLGGYDLGKINIKGVKTRSLKGLLLSDGSTISTDILVVELPHPTFLSNQTNEQASQAVARDLEVLRPYVNDGWGIPADPGMTNEFSAGQPYRYSRSNIGPEYYDFGTPGTRMVPVSTASRMGGNPHVIVFGTRDRAQFNRTSIDAMTEALPGETFSSEEMFIFRPRSRELRYLFDSGPGESYARLMKENLDFKKIFQLKTDKTFSSSGIDAYYVKNHPDIGDFGHYRGTFNRPRVLIVADPIGYDDLITARALTGTRGQHLQGLMKDLGVNDNYLVIKTVPFGMDDASDEDWEYTLEATSQYREALLGAILNDGTPELIITDGPRAKQEVMRILGEKPVPVINIHRQQDTAQADILDAAKDINALSQFKAAHIKAELLNIPRSHLSFYARTWEGTSGDRVLNSQDKFRGLAFAVVAPAWAWSQETNLIPAHNRDVEVLIEKLESNNLPLPGESIPDYLLRTKLDPRISFWEKILLHFFNAA
jgi:uracil-DNA glycosylase